MSSLYTPRKEEEKSNQMLEPL